MKQKILRLFIVFTFVTVILTFNKVSYANMAAPDNSDISTNITFKNNNDITITREELNIKVNGALANIEVNYYMKNISDSAVSTKSMFISPNIENSNVEVKFNAEDVIYITKEYYYNSNTVINVEEWEYVVFTEHYSEEYDMKVQTIHFKLLFDPYEEALVNVKYEYRLGGRPNNNDNLRYGELFYYLRPASTWKEFNELTINLELSESMPLLKDSNLDFIKLADRTYQYKSQGLPDKDLKLRIGLTRWQNFILRFKNPYFLTYVIIFAPFILVPIIIILSIIIIIITKKKKLNK